jgi:hypothetical protein
MTPLRLWLLMANLGALAVLGRLTQVDLVLPAGSLMVVAAFGDPLTGGKEAHT